MNTQSELERIVRGWLDDRVAQPPHAGLERVLERIPTTPQRRRSRLARWLAGIRKERLMLGATGMATIVVIAAFTAAIMIPAGREASPIIPGSGNDAPLVVAADGSGVATTISEALRMAGDGDTIRVKPGTYTESLTIDKDVTLAGDGPREDVVIVFTADSPRVPIHVGWPVEEEVPVGVALKGSDARITGVTISGPSPGLAIRVDGGAPVIDDVVIVLAGDPDSYSTNALAIYGATPTVQDSTWAGYVGVREGSAVRLHSNEITGGGISIDGPAASVITGNTLTGGASINPSEARGLIEGNDMTGGSLLIDSASDLVVRSNTIRDAFAAEGAIEVRDGSTAHVVDNVVTGSGTAVLVSAGSHATVEGNELSDNRVGVATTGSDVKLVSNEITGNDVGIAVGAGAPTFEGNVITGNDVGLRVDLGGRPVLSGDSVCDNGTNVEVAEGAAHVETGDCPSISAG